MSIYTHILVGLDLSVEAKQVLSKAMQLSAHHNAQLSVAHIIEPLAFAYGSEIPLDMTEAQDLIEKQANIRLSALLKELGLSPTNTFISIGQTAAELQRLAKQHEADLIVVGSHGRHGLALLLGSTANGVLHGARCDVLAVRVQE